MSSLDWFYEIFTKSFSIGAGGWVAGLSPGQSRDENVEMAEDISQVKNMFIYKEFVFFVWRMCLKKTYNLTNFALMGTESPVCSLRIVFFL